MQEQLCSPVTDHGYPKGSTRRDCLNPPPRDATLRIRSPRFSSNSKPGAAGQRLLIVEPYSDNWIERSFAIIGEYSVYSGLEAQVLLPHDIHREDYDSHYETICGYAAEAHLDDIALRPEQQQPRLVFVDLSLGLGDEDPMVVRKLNAGINEWWPAHSVLIVYAPAFAGLNMSMFNPR